MHISSSTSSSVTQELESHALRGSLLDLLDDSISALCSLGELVFHLGLLLVNLLLLLSLNAFHLLLVFFIVSLRLFEVRIFLRSSTSHLALELGLLGVEFFLCFFSLALNDLLNLLVVSLGLLLDGVEFADGALLCTCVLLLELVLGFLCHRLFLR